MTSGQIIRQLRSNRNQSIEKTAQDLNISKSALAMYERGERIPRDQVKLRIAEYFKVSVESLFFYPDEHICAQ